MVKRGKENLLEVGFGFAVLFVAPFLKVSSRPIGNEFPYWLFCLICFFQNSLPIQYYYFSVAKDFCLGNPAVSVVASLYFYIMILTPLNLYTMKNVNVKSAFIRFMSHSRPKSVDKYLGHHLIITQCLGQFPNYLYALTSFELRILKLQVKTTRPFLSKTLSTQNSYLTSLNALIRFVRSVELSAKKDAKVISLPKDQSGADSKKAA